MTALATSDITIEDGQIVTLTRPAHCETITLGGWCILDLNGMARYQRIMWSRRDVPSMVVHSINELEIGGGTQAQHHEIARRWREHRSKIARSSGEGPTIVFDMTVE